MLSFIQQGSTHALEKLVISKKHAFYSSKIRTDSEDIKDIIAEISERQEHSAYTRFLDFAYINQAHFDKEAVRLYENCPGDAMVKKLITVARNQLMGRDDVQRLCARFDLDVKK